jgi:LPXTG-site transpeptidase (sortase) family protein
MKKVGILALFLLLVGGGIVAGQKAGYVPTHSNGIPQVSQLPGQSGQEQEAGIPQKLRIPKFNIEATVEGVGLDAQKRMDIPKNSDDVGWYDLGPKPGEKGNAVIDGHLDKVTGAPSVFWNIAKLSAGDSIYVTDSNGKEYTFSVVKVSEYPDNNFPIQEVFGSSSVPMLNLITCQGTWDSAAKNYSDRVVVYSRLVE